MNYPILMNCFVNLEGKARGQKHTQCTATAKRLRNLQLDISEPTFVPGTDIALQSARKYESYGELLADILNIAVPELVRVFKNVRQTGMDRRGTVEGMISLEGDPSKLISKNQAFDFLQQALTLRDAIQSELKTLELNELVASARVAQSTSEPREQEREVDQQDRGELERTISKLQQQV